MQRPTGLCGRDLDLGPDLVLDLLENSLAPNQTVPIEAKLNNSFAGSAGCHSNSRRIDAPVGFLDKNDGITK